MEDRIDSNELGIDDVVLGADFFRMERMNDNSFWLAVYKNNVRTTFDISNDGYKITATLIEDHEESGL